MSFDTTDMCIDHDALDEAIFYMIVGMRWDQTPQGHDYWSDIVDILINYGGGVSPAPNATHTDPDDVQLAAYHLDGAFEWDESREGHGFWQNVYAKLIDIANHAAQQDSTITDDSVVQDDPIDAYDRAMKGL